MRSALDRVIDALARDASIEQKRRENKEAFHMVRFRNKLRGVEEEQEKFHPPHPDVWKRDFPNSEESR